jgi:elongator complex protein 3
LLNSVIPELKGKTAMIRELHVYGRVKEVGTKSKTESQHLGIGKSLLKKAEEISGHHGYNRIAVISGIGVRDYYRKRGYELQGTYMVKRIAWSNHIWIYMIIFSIIMYWVLN